MALEQRVPFVDNLNNQLLIQPSASAPPIPAGATELLAQPQLVAASTTIPLGIASRTGKLQDARIAAITPLTGNATYTVDIRRNGVTILTAPIALLTTTGARISVAGTLIASPPLVAVGDFFEAVIVNTPGTGTAPANILMQVAMILN